MPALVAASFLLLLLDQHIMHACDPQGCVDEVNSLLEPGDGADPTYIYSAEELQAIATKDAFDSRAISTDVSLRSHSH